MSVSCVVMCNLSCHICSSYFTSGRNSSFNCAFTGKNVKKFCTWLTMLPFIFQLLCHCLFSEYLRLACLIKATLTALSAQPPLWQPLLPLSLIPVKHILLSLSVCLSFHPPHSPHTAYSSEDTNWMSVWGVCLEEFTAEGNTYLMTNLQLCLFQPNPFNQPHPSSSLLHLSGANVPSYPSLHHSITLHRNKR